MNKIIVLFLFLLTLNQLFAKQSFSNCRFKNPNYTEICEEVVKHHVSYQYANEFLLSYFKTQKYDEITWKYIQPSKIVYHKEQERKANSVLVKHISQMVQNLHKYRAAYDYAQKKYGVNKEVIAAILFKETRLGKIKPRHDAFIVFNTILTRTKQKSSRNRWLLRMSKTNMASIIEYCYKKKVTPQQCNLPSSYAGAVGIPQFMPNSFIYAEGFHTKVADLTKMEDSIVSVAKFLHKKADFHKKILWSKMPNIAKVEKEWYAFSTLHPKASFLCKKNKSECFTKAKPELAYLGKYMAKIMRYNNSANYAIGVLRLAYEAHYKIKKGE